MRLPSTNAPRRRKQIERIPLRSQPASAAAASRRPPALVEKSETERA
jgi:hypothetical protein